MDAIPSRRRHPDHFQNAAISHVTLTTWNGFGKKACSFEISDKCVESSTCNLRPRSLPKPTIGSWGQAATLNLSTLRGLLAGKMKNANGEWLRKSPVCFSCYLVALIVRKDFWLFQGVHNVSTRETPLSLCERIRLEMLRKLDDSQAHCLRQE